MDLVDNLLVINTDEQQRAYDLPAENPQLSSATAITMAQIQSGRPSYTNAILIVSRGEIMDTVSLFQFICYHTLIYFLL